ncbi:arsenate reductase (glutaredoxin) [Pedobacter ginsengisoli]|uniref:Arsenate reductase (Glutaredoxin) n=1 Tax=Pedobacter ginsengisoli TaxID=363852 RepID=A0A2D1U5Z4_9SPHI|nr:arsenate reductase (glutaredoxin) [Pedobacter ginsengisoli]ATP57008.1 arsenate reductase (glutaredoxin) [Pedobacter ginsengisoli]
MIRIYHNSRCSKSRCALTVLEDSGKEFEVVNYLETIPTADELRTIIAKLGISAHELVRKSENIYKEQFKGRDLSDEEWVLAMIENPILIERPILVSDDLAVIARPTEKIYDIL